MSKKQVAEIKGITPLTDSIIQMILAPASYVDYVAGQYLQIMVEDEPLSYSIANAPLGAHHYELHIRHGLENPGSQALLAEMKSKGAVSIDLPFGDCHLEQLDPEKPVIFIAAGTGFAPVKAMIEQLLADADPRRMELYWVARSQSDLYMDDKANYWQEHIKQFHYFSAIASRGQSPMAEMVLKNHPEGLKDWQVVISGPFDMVYQNRDILLENGLSRNQLFSDAFSFEPK